MAHLVILLVFCLTSPSVTQSGGLQMIVDNEVERMWNEVGVASFETFVAEFV
jgi:hypothetical protein